MTFVNRFMTRVFDVVFAPFENVPGWLSLLVFSIVGAVFGLLVYKYTSNQAGIKRVKDRIKANLLAVKLFRDELGVMFRACGAILLCAVRLLRYSLVPFGVMIVPFVLVVTQLAMRYQWRPVEPGDTVVMTVRMSGDRDVMRSTPSLEPNDGVTADAPRLRIPTEGEVVWRLRALQPGRHTLRLRVGDEVIEKSCNVGGRFSRVGVRRSGPGGWDRLLYPSEPVLSADSAVRSVEIAYPVREGWIGGASSWVVWLVVLSVVVGYVVKPLLRVEF